MGIGPLELATIAAIALMVLGTDNFPEFARTVARAVRETDDRKMDFAPFDLVLMTAMAALCGSVVAKLLTA